MSSSSSSQYNFFNVDSKFADKRWRYTAPEGFVDNDGHNITGETLYKNGYINGALGLYKNLNANASLWNPADVVNNVMFSYFVEDGSFLRLNDLTIGYTLPTTLTKKWGISRLRLYVTGSNIFCITGYSGYDPEVDIQNGLTPNVDWNRYPRSHSYLFGVNLSF